MTFLMFIASSTKLDYHGLYTSLDSLSSGDDVLVVDCPLPSEGPSRSEGL